MLVAAANQNVTTTTTTDASPVLISVYDFTITSLVLALFFLSTVSLFFIFHLRFKSQNTHHLQNFNTLWTLRLLLVSFVTLWTVNEALHLPFFHRRFIYPFFPTLNLAQQVKMCKIHVLLSLGFFEPGFLITLLFLILLSIKQRTQSDTRVITLIMFICFPLLTLQTISLFFTPFIPGIIFRSFDHKTNLCSYPLLSTIVFGAFGAVYTIVLLLSCQRLINLVINKGTRVRIRLLAAAVASSIPLQILFLTLSSFWSPGTVEYGGVMLGMFLCAAACAVAAQGILVIKPIVDALTSGDNNNNNIYVDIPNLDLPEVLNDWSSPG